MALTRSEQMSRIRGTHTGPERILRRLLWHAGLRYRLHVRTPAGRPDVVFSSRKVAVFIDGCFWHGCPEHYVRPRSSGAFWTEKLAQNVRRDVDQTHRLEELGWRVLRVWEHEVFEEPDAVVGRIRSAIRNRHWDPPDSWRVWKVAEADPAADTEHRYMRDLRNEARRRTVTRKRSTRKWAVNTQRS